MDSLRILIWQWGRKAGGPISLYRTAQELLADPGVTVFLSYSRQAEVADEIEQLGLPGFPINTYTSLAGFFLGFLRLPFIAVKLHRFLVNNKIDIVWCPMTHVWNIFLMPIFKIAKVKVIGAVHDFEPHPGENFPGRTAWLNAEARMMDGLVCFSGHVRDGLVQRRVVQQEQIRLLPLPTFGYDGAVPRSAPRDRVVRLLFFGRILAYKGLAILFEAVRILQHQGQRISLDVVGYGEVPMESAKGIQDLNLRQGWIPEEEIPAIFDAADICICPYVEASQSGIVALAYSRGVPVVVTPVGGLVEQVTDGATGVIASAPEPNAVAGALRRLLSDRELYERCSREGIAAHTGPLSWAQHVKNLKQFFDENSGKD